jgi:molybdate-binding protein
VLPLLRSSAQALDLLRRGLVHAAGVHVTDAAGRSTNGRVVRAVLGPGYRLLHQVRWDTGIATGTGRRERSAQALLRANVRWVNREEGSGARQTFDTLLAARRRPAGYEHVVRDHRAVATTVSSGWAEAGICVRPAAAEAHLPFIPVQQEAYELCVADAQMGDPRVAALLATLQSKAYRQLLADVPGCSAAGTGNVRAAA